MPRLFANAPPVLRALLAQAVALPATLALAAFLAARVPVWTWPLVQGVLAASVGTAWGLGPGWRLFQALLPFALAWQLGHTVPAWVYPVVLAGLLLVFGGGVRTRVPLYNSNRAAWTALADLLPPEDGFRMVDLGAGLGGPLAFLARLRPGGQFLGVEGSPLVWLVAWLRTARLRSNCRIAFGDLWKVPLHDFEVVYAFLSPAPMPELWAKARREMRPGTLLVSHSFRIPEAVPEREIPLTGRRDACLLVYRL